MARATMTGAVLVLLLGGCNPYGDGPYWVDDRDPDMAGPLPLREDEIPEAEPEQEGREAGQLEATPEEDGTGAVE